MCNGNLMCNFWKKLDKITMKYIKNQNYNVFHYTNNLDSIMKSGYLKLHSHEFQNKKDKDNDELACGVELVQKMIKSSSLSKFLEIFDNYIKKGLEVYTCSFCEVKKSPYAFKKYGRSYICFKKTFFLKLEEDTLQRTLYGKVIYNKKTQKKIIKDLFDCYEKYSNLCTNRIVCFFSYITLILPLLKHHRHNLDKEHRIISIQVKDESEKLVTQALKKANFISRDIKDKFTLQS